MRRKGVLRTTTCLVVIAAFLTASCATLTTEQTLGCLGIGAGVGAAGGAAIGAATARDRLGGALIGAAIGAALGAVAGLTTCIVVAESRSRQVKSYQETQQAINYQPSQGDRVQVTHYAVTPAAAAPGSEVAFNATYYVMTANPDQEVPITETRILRVYDPARNEYRELGRVPTHVTVKPGTRQADGKFEIRSGVAEGKYLIIFQVAKNGVSDTKELPLIVTKNQAVLGAPSSQIAQVVAEGAKAPEVLTTQPAPTPAKPDEMTPSAPPSSAPGGPLAALGEREPKPPAPPAVPAPAPEISGVQKEKARYFVASKVTGKGNLREGPGTTYKIVGEIKEGERFLIIDHKTNPGEEISWYKVRLDSGLEAWVLGSLGMEVQE